MKMNSLFLTAISTFLLMLYSPLQANQLDGLWRNTRQNITVRIEQDGDGIRAKRIDQGIWYRYTATDENTFVDRNGNKYDWITDNEMVWTESGSAKRISFSRVKEDRDNPDYRDDDWKRDRDDDRRYDERDQDWDRDRGHVRSSLEGRWYDRQHRQYVDVKTFKGGLMVKMRHGGYDKYYADRSGTRFKNNNGNTIQVMDRDTLRLRTTQGRDVRIFTRNDHKHDNHPGKGKHGKGKPW
jgi:hypothetical protein